MDKTVLQLYPTREEALSLRGLYLRHNLRETGEKGKPFVYTNYLASLDGRIGVPKAGADTHEVPPAIANRRDWRLFQELAAQADVLITTARYFRQLHAGHAQDSLPVGRDDAYADLLDWRIQQGLTPQPSLAILSASLDFPHALVESHLHRGVYVLTGDTADDKRIGAIEARGIPVFRAGAGPGAEGARLVATLAQQGFNLQYAIAGPKVVHTLLTAGVLNRLYLTVAHRILGGAEFDTFAQGDALSPAVNLSLRELYYDVHAPQSAGQWFSVFDTL